MGLFALIRNKISEFVENKKIANLILGMTIFLCIEIFAELAFDDQITANKQAEFFFYILNFFLLTFFILEIILKCLAYGPGFFFEFINAFDSTIVIASYVMIILNLKLKILGLLRVMRLLKVIINMKKVVDDNRERQEGIKQ